MGGDGCARSDGGRLEASTARWLGRWRIAVASGVLLMVVAAACAAQARREAGRWPWRIRLEEELKLYVDGTVDCALDLCELEREYHKDAADGYNCAEQGLSLGDNCGDRGCTKGGRGCYVLDPSPHTVELVTKSDAYMWQCIDGYTNENGFCIRCGEAGVECVDSLCFPGDALVHVRGRGPAPIASLQAGEQVLVELLPGHVEFEPVLGFLHVLRADKNAAHRFLTVVHARGHLRASANHLVFRAEGALRTTTTVAGLRPGDRIFVASPGGNDTGTTTSEVLAILRGVTQLGMHAPLTPSGTLLVDGAIASVYAAHSATAWLPHGAAHALFFVVRAYHTLGGGRFSWPQWVRGSSGAHAGYHPFVALLYERLQLQLLLTSS